MFLKETARNLGSYIPGNVVEDIAAVKTVLRAWQTAFANTESRASTFATAISNIDIDAIVAEFNAAHGTDIIFDEELTLIHVLNLPEFAYHLEHATR